MKRVLAPLFLLVAGPLGADQVFLKGGGQLNGVVVARTASSIVVEVAPGRVTLPISRVERVVQGTSALEAFRESSTRLLSDDVTGWLALAQWALDRDLQTQARGAFEHVALVDPSNATARRALGQSLIGGQWLSEADAYRARGFVRFGGEWMTPAERDAAVQAEEARMGASARRTEAEARVREAEARASAAEAEARRAEGSNGMDGAGFPYPWVFGGSVCHFGCGHSTTPRVPHTTAPTPAPIPAPVPHSASIWATPPKTVH
jgi:hypothetical protein